MKKRNKNKNGWPRGSQNERTLRAAVPPKNVVADSDKETSAASTDEDDSDDGDGDGTPAAFTAGKKSRPNKRTEAFPAVDQGETGDKETQLLEEAQEESREEVKGCPVSKRVKGKGIAHMIDNMTDEIMEIHDSRGPRYGEEGITPVTTWHTIGHCERV